MIEQKSPDSRRARLVKLNRRDHGAVRGQEKVSVDRREHRQSTRRRCRRPWTFQTRNNLLVIFLIAAVGVVGFGLIDNWQDGYGAFSIGESQVRTVSKYILTQKERHTVVALEEEFSRESTA